MTAPISDAAKRLPNQHGGGGLTAAELDALEATLVPCACGAPVIEVEIHSSEMVRVYHETEDGDYSYDCWTGPWMNTPASAVAEWNRVMGALAQSGAQREAK